MVRVTSDLPKVTKLVNRSRFSSVAQSWLTLCDPMNHTMPGLPVHHQLPEFTQTHVHWVDDAIQPSHPLSSPFPPAFNLSQHQGLFKRVSFSNHIGVSASTSVLPMNIQDWFPLGWTGWISMQIKIITLFIWIFSPSSILSATEDLALPRYWKCT